MLPMARMQFANDNLRMTTCVRLESVNRLRIQEMYSLRLIHCLNNCIIEFIV